ncbi:hypothetical protein FOA52_008665 [Chlamydomonas sp. UWO 241]|nr:hypothetical protein FOA52_008665 [Chlamydomonas sp. UWO 241]
MLIVNCQLQAALDNALERHSAAKAAREAQAEREAVTTAAQTQRAQQQKGQQQGQVQASAARQPTSYEEAAALVASVASGPRSAPAPRAWGAPAAAAGSAGATMPLQKPAPGVSGLQQRPARGGAAAILNLEGARPGLAGGSAAGGAQRPPSGGFQKAAAPYGRPVQAPSLSHAQPSRKKELLSSLNARGGGRGSRGGSDGEGEDDGGDFFDRPQASRGLGDGARAAAAAVAASILGDSPGGGSGRASARGEGSGGWKSPPGNTKAPATFKKSSALAWKIADARGKADGAAAAAAEAQEQQAQQQAQHARQAQQAQQARAQQQSAASPEPSAQRPTAYRDGLLPSSTMRRVFSRPASGGDAAAAQHRQAGGAHATPALAAQWGTEGQTGQLASRQHHADSQVWGSGGEHRFI